MTPAFAKTLKADLITRKAAGESEAEALRYAEITCGKANEEFSVKNGPDHVDGRDLVAQLYKTATAPKAPAAPKAAAPAVAAPAAPEPVPKKAATPKHK